MRITGTAKAIFSIVFFTCLICGMSACSSPSSSSNPSSSKAETQEVSSQSGNQEFNVPGEQQILADVQAKDGYYSTYSLNIDSFSMVKRQTNADDKNDFVWYTVVASNSDFSYSAEYKVTYVLYNDGWLLEDCSKEAFSIKPLCYPTREDAQAAINKKYGEGSRRLFDMVQQSDTEVTYPYLTAGGGKSAVFYQFYPETGWTYEIADAYFAVSE